MAGESQVRRVLGIVGLIVSLGVLGVVVVASQRERVDDGTSAPVVRALAPGRGEHLQAMPANAAELHEWLSQRVRLKPDRRALLALADVRRLQRDATESADVRWADGHWAVTLGGHEVGTLPETADFTDLLTLVTRAAAEATTSLRAGAPAPEAASQPTLTPSHPTLTTLLALDAAWASGSRTPDVVAAAARALTALAIETPDTLDGTDALDARALAALAWARAAGRPDTEYEALLARHMGYDRAAAELAAPLPDTSPVRWWVTREDARLRALAERDDATGAARYLWFRRLVERRARVEAFAWRDAKLAGSTNAIAVMGFEAAAWGANPIEAYAPFVRTQASRVLAALEHEASVDAPAADDAALFTRLDALAARRPERGRFTDRALLAARDAAAVRSALHDDLAFRLDVLSSPASAMQLATALVNAAPPAHTDFAMWAQNLAVVSGNTAPPETLVRELGADTRLGGAMMIRTYADLVPAIGSDAQRRSALEHLAAKLDGRPSHRAYLATALGATLHDVPRSAHGCDDALRLSRYARPAATVWCYAARGDGAALLAMANDPSFSTRTRSDAAEAADGHAPREAVNAAWTAVLTAAPDDLDPRIVRVEKLMARNGLREAETLLRAWLAEHGHDAGLGPMHARARLGAVLRAQGHAEASWALVQPDLASMVGRSLEEGVRALLALRRYDEADALAQSMRQRYPNAESIALVAEALWTRGAPDGASQALVGSLELLTPADWSSPIGTTFARVFRAASVEATMAAFAPLARDVPNPDNLASVSGALASASRNDLAAATYASIHYSALLTNPFDQLKAVSQQYAYRRAAQGVEPALAWIRSAVAPELRAPLSMFIYAHDAPEVMWSVVDATDPDDATFVWLLRAADALRNDPAHTHRDALAEFFRTANPDDYVVIARHLLGEVPASEVLPRATTEKRRTEVSYYLGLRAASEGHLDEASDWFQLTGLVGSTTDGEYDWAELVLDAWAARAEPLASLAAHPWAPPSAASTGAGAAATGTVLPMDPSRASEAAAGPAARHGRRHRERGGHHGHRRRR